MKKNKVFLLVGVAFVFLATACSGLPINGNDNGDIHASGRISALRVDVATEVGGIVSSINVIEGDSVKAGDVLFRLDDSFLKTQFIQAEAGLSVAQANYDLALATKRITEKQQQANIEGAKLQITSAQQALDALYENADLLAAQTLQAKDNTEELLEDLVNIELQQALALLAIADAEKAIEDTNRRFNTVQTTASQADIDSAKSQVVLARDALDKAKEDFEPYEEKPEDNLTRASFQAKLAAAQGAYDAAVRRLNALESTGTDADIAVARANYATAQAQLIQAQRDWEEIQDGPNPIDVAFLEAQIAKFDLELEKLRDGPDPDAIEIADDQIATAKAQLVAAQAGTPVMEQIAVAQAQVEVARSNIETINVQLEKTVSRAPISGIVLVRNLEPSEMAAPGSTVMVIGSLEEVKLVVYVPEDKYGQIQLKQSVKITADSFPGESFDGQVIRIADEAEFTPRNVQTVEGRLATVYAVEILAPNPDLRLKPGMPADVVINVP
jgi:HlyD family secretion protein